VEGALDVLHRQLAVTHQLARLPINAARPEYIPISCPPIGQMGKIK
jgi:hypothetical protein